MMGRSLPRAMRRSWSANSVSVRTTRSGAPSTVAEPIEPENMPISNPSDSAMRADMASNTEAGCTQTSPSSTRRYRRRRSEGCMGLSLDVEVDEIERRGRPLEHAPALEPVERALHLVERDRCGVADGDAALAQVADAERRDLRVVLVIVDEV